MDNNFYSAITNRRSIYGIMKDTVISDERLTEIIEEAVLHCPTAFNSQSGRVVILLGDHHDKLWEITLETLRKRIPVDKFHSTEVKLGSFKNGYGTILFFEEMDIVEELCEKFPSYKENFPVWSMQSSGMLQYIVWTALELEGLGVSLQHYNPLIDEEVKKEWELPNSWKLISQMPFGKPTAPAGDKEFKPLNQRMKVFK